MRLSLSRITALLTMAIALAMVPGAAAVRVAGRDRDRGAARVTSVRGGAHRLDSSDPSLHGHEEVAPDTAEAGDTLHDAVVSAAHERTAATAVLLPATVSVPLPSTGWRRLGVPPVRSGRASTVPRASAGRAPPVL